MSSLITGRKLTAGGGRLMLVDAGGQIDITALLQRATRRRILRHDYARGHGAARDLLHAAEGQPHLSQFVLRLRVGEAGQLRHFRDQRAFADGEEDLRALVDLSPAGYRLLEDLAGVFFEAFLGPYADSEAGFGEELARLPRREAFHRGSLDLARAGPRPSGTFGRLPQCASSVARDATCVWVSQ